MPAVARSIAAMAARQWGFDAKRKKRSGFFVIGRSSRQIEVIAGHYAIRQFWGVDGACFYCSVHRGRKEPRAMSMEKTVYMIRPFGMPFRHTIRQRILREGLSIVASRELKIPRWAFEEIYPRHTDSKVPDEVWMRRLVLTTGNLSEVGVLEGEDAVARLVRLVGTEADPAEWEVVTIRRDYGASAAECIGGFVFHYRVMHRPVDEEEALRNLSTIEKLLRT